MPAVSVIIPVYNVEKYLRQCMDSVVNQTLKDIEIICIDDGSTDSSSQIIDEYAKTDKRIIVIHKENGGYGKAMNIGLDLATGEYIGIVEPDDFIATNMYEKLYDIARITGVQFVKANYFTYENEKISNRVSLIASEDFFNRELTNEQIRKLLLGQIAHWAGIYNRTFLNENGIRFNETPGAAYQDLGFWFLVYAFANAAYLDKEAYYFYRQDNPNASMANRHKVYCVCDEFKYIYDNLKKSSIFSEVLKYYQCRKFKTYTFNLDRIDEQYKLEFLCRISKEFNASQLEKQLECSLFKDNERELLFEIMDNPYNHYEKYKEGIFEFNNNVLNYEKVYVYGAGNVARKVVRYLKRIRVNVAAIIVTNKDGNPTQIEDIPVIAIDDEMLQLCDSCVIISFVAPAKCDVEINLNSRGVKKILYATNSIAKWLL